MSTSQEESTDLPVAVSIATSDSGASAGLQADLLTFAARGVFGTTIFVALTAQNPDGVSAIETLPVSFIRDQWSQVSGYFTPGAIKTGMLFSAEIIECVADLLADTRCPLVVDPVMVASSGTVLLQPDAIDTLKARLLPRASLVTPNLDEAGVLAGSRPENLDDMRRVAHSLQETFHTAVLLKGGHLKTDILTDLLVGPSGEETAFESPYRRGVDTHGSGCTLASAITAELAKGKSLEEAVGEAHRYLQLAMARPLKVGGVRFISHGVREA